ncbi:MAG: hypothetical protein ACE5I1_27555 [bacterium]
MKPKMVIAAIFLFGSVLFGQGYKMPAILSMRERAQVRDQWLGMRLSTVVPEVMRHEKIDMWIILTREYNEDPVIKTMLPATWLAARRRTILVFFDRGGKTDVERLAVARYDIGEFFITPHIQTSSMFKLKFRNGTIGKCESCLNKIFFLPAMESGLLTAGRQTCI